jgi:hypothetical protein
VLVRVARLLSPRSMHRRLPARTPPMRRQHASRLADAIASHSEADSGHRLCRCRRRCRRGLARALGRPRPTPHTQPDQQPDESRWTEELARRVLHCQVSSRRPAASLFRGLGRSFGAGRTGRAARGFPDRPGVRPSSPGSGSQPSRDASDRDGERGRCSRLGGATPGRAQRH